MLRKGVIPIVWPDQSVAEPLLAAAESITLPTLPGGQSPVAMLLTMQSNQRMAFTLSIGTVALSDIDEGVMFDPNAGYMIVNSIGKDTINTFASGGCTIHITPLSG